MSTTAVLSELKALPAPERGFPVEEYELRLKMVQSAMEKQAIDCLLLNTEADVRYFSGYLTQFWQSPTRPWYLLVPGSGKPVAVIPSIGVECMSRTWVDDIRSWSSPHESDDGVSLLIDTLKSLVGDSSSIGLLMGRETHFRAPLNNLLEVQAALPECNWCDATDLVQSQRVVKSWREIEKIRYVASVASKAFEMVPEILSVGMTETDAFRAFKIACLQLGADDVPYLVGGAGAGGYGDIISPPSMRPLENGDVLILDTGCQWDGYFCDFDRNFAIDDVDDAVHTAHAVCWQATQAGIDAATAGSSCAGLFHAMNNVMVPHESNADGAVGRLGHGLGMQLTEHPSHTEWDQTKLEAGMVLTVEPGYSFAADKMMVHEENIVVTSGAAELLSVRAPQNLPVIKKL